jgi:hypothetical protein
VGGFSSIAESDFSQPADSAYMHTAEQDVVASVISSGSRAHRRLAFMGGGTDGNEQLTSLAGAVLIVLLAVLGITIVRIGQLIWLHLFLGLALLGPVVIKMASTGYRFVRYYAHDSAYRAKGPPELLMRMSAPLVVASTMVVFVSGIMLLFEGPGSRSQLLPLHKISFIVWGAFFALHVLGHLPGMGRALRHERAGASPGAAGRWITLAGALVAGLIVAVVLIPQFGPWTAHAALSHHHHH